MHDGSKCMEHSAPCTPVDMVSKLKLTLLEKVAWLECEGKEKEDVPAKVELEDNGGAPQAAC